MNALYIQMWYYKKMIADSYAKITAIIRKQNGVYLPVMLPPIEHFVENRADFIIGFDPININGKAQKPVIFKKNEQGQYVPVESKN
jgi:hypothetical protein